MEEQPTYKTYVLRQVMPSPGWQAVYWQNGTHCQDGTHYTIPIYALGLGYANVYAIPGGALVPPPTRLNPDELWEIMGLDYDPINAFTVCNEDSDFCGLLPPDWTLEQFKAVNGCHKHHLKEDADAASGEPERRNQ